MRSGRSRRSTRSSAPPASSWALRATSDEQTPVTSRSIFSSWWKTLQPLSVSSVEHSACSSTSCRTSIRDHGRSHRRATRSEPARLAVLHHRRRSPEPSPRPDRYALVAERLFNYRPIGRLSREDASTHSVSGRTTRAEYQPEALGVLLDAAGGYPYFIQEYGQSAWNLAPDASSPRLTPKLPFSSGRSNSMPGSSGPAGDRATPSERRMLFAMAADGDGPSPTATVAQRMGLQTPAAGAVPGSTHHEGSRLRARARTDRLHRARHGGYVGRHHDDLDVAP